MPRKIFSKVLMDKNENKFYKPNNHIDDGACLQVLQEIEVKTTENDKFKDTTVFARKSVFECEYENILNPGEIARLRSFRDENVLFYKQKKYLQPIGKDHFSLLSDEIILHIFKMLTKPILVKCSLVCKRWKELSYDETLWKRHDFGRKVVKQGTLEVLLKRGVTVLRLAMSEIKDPAFSNAYIGYKWRCNLQYLDLSMANISPQSLSNLLSKCCSLKKLSVEHCILNEECCNNIAENINLEVLNMAMCEGLTPKGLQAICLWCKNLKEWNLAWTKMSETCLEVFSQRAPSNLLRLNLSGNKKTLSDYALIDIVKRCKGLRELDISDNVQITNASFETLIKTCTNLQHLHTSRSYNIPAECNKLLKDLKNFKNLEIFQTLSDSGLATLKEYMPEVKINQHVLSTIARPTVGIRRTSIWELPTRD